MSTFFEYPQITKGRKHYHVSAIAINGVVQIRDLYAQESCKNKRMEHKLLRLVELFAAGQNAKKIIVYCGPEDFGHSRFSSLEQEMEFYQSHGFRHVGTVGTAPMLEKCL